MISSPAQLPPLIEPLALAEALLRTLQIVLKGKPTGWVPMTRGLKQILNETTVYGRANTFLAGARFARRHPCAFRRQDEGATAPEGPKGARQR